MNYTTNIDMDKEFSYGYSLNIPGITECLDFIKSKHIHNLGLSLNKTVVNNLYNRDEPVNEEYSSDDDVPDLVEAFDSNDNVPVLVEVFDSDDDVPDLVEAFDSDIGISNFKKYSNIPYLELVSAFKPDKNFKPGIFKVYPPGTIIIT